MISLKLKVIKLIYLKKFNILILRMSYYKLNKEQLMQECISRNITINKKLFKRFN